MSTSTPHWLTDLHPSPQGWEGAIGGLSCTVTGSPDTDYVATVVLGANRWTARDRDPQVALNSATEQAVQWAAGWSYGIRALVKRARELATLRRPPPKRAPYST
jgi:hypothetical protein